MIKEEWNKTQNDAPFVAFYDIRAVTFVLPDEMADVSIAGFIDYFRLFIVATGCPSERRPRRRLVVTGDSARIQDETTENSAWFFNMLGV